MELKVYHGEYFERSKTRYIIFFLIIATVIIGSIFSGNIIGAIVILLFVGGYFFFLLKTNTICLINIGESGITIKDKTYPWNEIKGFVLEYHTKNKTIKNIVLIENADYQIFTIDDTIDNLKEFIAQLGERIPLLESYEQSFFERFLRKIQL